MTSDKNISKLLFYDTSVGYSRYLAGRLPCDYYMKIIKKRFNLKKIDISEFDTLLYIINDEDDFFLFSKIHKNFPVNLKILIGTTSSDINIAQFKRIIPLDLALSKKELYSEITEKLKSA